MHGGLSVLYVLTVQNTFTENNVRSKTNSNEKLLDLALTSYAMRNFQYFTHPYITTTFAFRVPKHMAWLEDVNMYLELIKAMGLIQKFVSDPFPSTATHPWTSAELDTSLKPLALSHIFLAPAVLLVGVGIASVSFIREKVKRVTVHGG